MSDRVVTMIAGEDISKGELVVVDTETNVVYSARKCRPGRHTYVNSVCIFCSIKEGSEPGLDNVETSETRIPTIGVVQTTLKE